jgi:hypothetical protein
MNRLDFSGLQETKETINDSFLKAMAKNFDWRYVPARGTAGGILRGFKSTVFEVLTWDVFQYCGIATVMNTSDKFVWRVIVVYRSPYEETKVEFVEELHRVMSMWVGPTLVGGDFNLVRNQNEKSNGSVNFRHVELFNN